MFCIEYGGKKRQSHYSSSNNYTKTTMEKNSIVSLFLHNKIKRKKNKSSIYRQSDSKKRKSVLEWEKNKQKTQKIKCYNSNAVILYFSPSLPLTQKLFQVFLFL